MEPVIIFWMLYFFYFLSQIWHFYLSWRQYKLYTRTATRPSSVQGIISEEDYAKARAYKIDKMRFGFFLGAFNMVVTTAVLMSNLKPWAWGFCSQLAFYVWPNSGEIWQSIVFIWLSTIFKTVTLLPFSFYYTFYVEQKHGFNKEKIPFFFKDRMKKLAISLLIMSPVISLVILIIRFGGPNFHIFVWAFISVVIFGMMFVYPEFIAPLFDKYTALPESALKGKIEALAKRVDFPLSLIYVVEGSKRSSHSNAYMYGFWKNKRIVLYDTLLSTEMNEMLKQSEKNQTSEKDESNIADEGRKRKQLGMHDDEVVAVLGHELGHWKLYHSVGLLISKELNLLLMLFIFSLFYQQQQLFFAFGFPAGAQPAVIGLAIILQYVMAPYKDVLSVLMNVLSRKMEFAADRFSANLGCSEELISGLVKLGNDNLSMPIDDWLYSWCNHSHPPVPERIEALKKYE